MARILVAEPDRQIRSLISGILAEFGHQVQQAETIGEARGQLRRGEFDLLASDFASEEPNAKLAELARQLPVVTLTGAPVRPGTDKYARPPRLHDKPFRFADLGCLIAAIVSCEPAATLAA